MIVAIIIYNILINEYVIMHNNIITLVIVGYIVGNVLLLLHLANICAFPLSKAQQWTELWDNNIGK